MPLTMVDIVSFNYRHGWKDETKRFLESLGFIVGIYTTIILNFGL